MRRSLQQWAPCHERKASRESRNGGFGWADGSPSLVGLQGKPKAKIAKPVPERADLGDLKQS